MRPFMRISVDTVRHIANLAQVELAESEVLELQADLERILEHVDALNQIDTANVAPTTHPVMLPERLRPDDVCASWPTERVLRAAPETAAGGFAVPRIIG